MSLIMVLVAYWVLTQLKAWSLILCADLTGHGVPNYLVNIILSLRESVSGWDEHLNL